MGSSGVAVHIREAVREDAPLIVRFIKDIAEFEKLSTEVGGIGAILHSYGFDHEQTQKLIEKCASRKPDDDLCKLADPHLPVFSLQSGTIIFRDVIVGEHVEPNKILFTNTQWRKAIMLPSPL